MLPSISTAQVILWIALLAWLGACVTFDLRSRQVPALMTLPPLILAALWRLLHGDWPMVLLVVALILISDVPQAKWHIPLACLVSLLALSSTQSSGSIYAMLVIFAVWAMWDRGATGGADAKIIITLVLIFADGLLFVPIVLVGGIQGLFGLIAKRKTIPFTVAITLGTVAWLWVTSGH